MIRHEHNRKLGGSLKTGFAAATKDLVLYMDADLPFDPDALGRAMRAMARDRRGPHRRLPSRPHAGRARSGRSTRISTTV